MEQVALKILERPECDINVINKNNDTALIWAYSNKMHYIALKISEK
jgi:hypothetical protein